MEYRRDTICAPATSVGTGAINIVRVSGPETLSIVDRVVSFRSGDASSSKGYRLKFGAVLDGGEVLDELLVAVFRAPNSYTGEDSAEFYCHASGYIVTRLLALLVEAGCRMAGPGEFTQRAYTAGKLDLAQAEAVVDVINASSAASHRVAMNQLRGGYSSELKGLRDRLVELAALLELELDFSEEEVEFADRSRLNALLDSAQSQVDSLAASFKVGNAIRNGVPVAIVGSVNSGKSTLLNALVGDDRAIVSDVPGTTRDTIEEVVTLDGVQFRFIDTAGLRETDDTVEKIGIGRSLDALSKADVVIGVVDGTLAEADFEALAGDIRSKVGEDQSLVLVASKKDLWGSDVAFPDALAISARTGEGLAELRSRLADSQRGRLADAGSTVVTSLRHYESLRSASASLSALRTSLQLGVPTDLAAEDLRAAIASLNSIFGESIDPDEVLGNIFGRFCIGK